MFKAGFVGTLVTCLVLQGPTGAIRVQLSHGIPPPCVKPSETLLAPFQFGAPRLFLKLGSVLAETGHFLFCLDNIRDVCKQ